MEGFGFELQTTVSSPWGSGTEVKGLPLYLPLPAERCLYPVTAITLLPVQGLKAEPALGASYCQVLSTSGLWSHGDSGSKTRGQRERQSQEARDIILLWYYSLQSVCLLSPSRRAGQDW